MMTHLTRRDFLARTLGGGALLGAMPDPALSGSLAEPRARFESTGASSRALPKLVLPHPSGAQVEIYLHGAHVTSWKRADGEEMLFLGANNRFQPDETIRGGIPVIFPQFANLGPLPGHGFLKTARWQVAETGTDAGGAVFARLDTADTAATRAMWPHAFRASLLVTLDDGLTTAITIDNRGDRAMSFHCVLHTYHRVGDLRRVTIEGLEGATYQDRLAAGVERVETTVPLRVEGETNRIYVGRTGRLRIRDASRGRLVLVDRVGFDDVVVWNPGELKARTNSNLADGEYLRMLAVECAAIAPPIHLQPGRSWTGTQRIGVA